MTSPKWVPTVGVFHPLPRGGDFRFRGGSFGQKSPVTENLRGGASPPLGLPPWGAGTLDAQGGSSRGLFSAEYWMTPRPTGVEFSGVRGGGVNLGCSWVDLVTRQINKMILSDVKNVAAIFPV